MADPSQPRPHAGHGARRSAQTQTRNTPSPLPAALAAGLGLLLTSPPQARALAFTGDLITNPTFFSGDVVIYDGVLTNVSDQTAIFGTNTWGNGASLDIMIGPYPALSSPYLESSHAHWFTQQVLGPGESVRWPFLFFDTSADMPLNTLITVSGNYLYFTSLPPTDYLVIQYTANPTISVPRQPPAVPVPGPAGAPLFGLALLSRLRAVRRRQTTGASGPS